jgi:hypothetical protein
MNGVALSGVMQSTTSPTSSKELPDRTLRSGSTDNIAVLGFSW